MSDRYSERLSEYLDHELSAADRSEMDSHLRECAECAATLAGLKHVVARAGALAVDAAPEADLWPGILARIGGGARPAAIPIETARHAGRNRSFSVPQLAAACLVAAVLSGVAVWLAGGGGPRETGELIPGSRGAAEPASANAGASSAAVEELRGALANGRDKLDPATVRTMEESLMVIEIAIREARRALEADPHNPYVREHLDETLQRKEDLLLRATMLASAPR